jgi:hypothetical protein
MLCLPAGVQTGRGGKSAYFEGGVRAASFVHSPLLPSHTAGTVLSGLVSIADWFATICFLAGVDPSDDGHMREGAGAAASSSHLRRTGHSDDPLPAPYGHGTFPVDSVNLWPWLSGANTSAPRQELVLGKMAGGSLIAAGGYKIVLGAQSPDWWYGSYAPNCTDGNGGHPFNCEDGCLFQINDDPGEHIDLKASQPSRFAELKAKLESAQAVTEAPITPAQSEAAVSAACVAMQTKWHGFFGPYDGIPPSPSPSPSPSPPSPRPSPAPAPSPRSDCAWQSDVDYDIGAAGEWPAKNAMSKEHCCALCWAQPLCAVAVFSGAKAKGRCGVPPGRNCCWLKTAAQAQHPASDGGVVSCKPRRHNVSLP